MRVNKKGLCFHRVTGWMAVWKRILIAGFFFQRTISLAQGIPQIGTEEELAGVRIQLTEPIRRVVQQETEKLYMNRSLVVTKLEQLIFYFPFIEPQLAQHGLPDDFKFLALQDSLLLVDRPSAGWWALPKTVSLGLRVDPVVDERLHVLRSTAVVIERLKGLHAQQANWASVIHTYDRLVRSDSVSTNLPETAGNATTYILNNNKDELLIRVLVCKAVLERSLAVYHPQRQMALFPLEVAKATTLKQVADYFQMEERDLARYNSWLKTAVIPADSQHPSVVFLPASLEQYPELKRRVSFFESDAITQPDVGFPIVQKLTDKTDAQEAVFYQINGKKGVQARLYDNPVSLAYTGKVKVRKFLRYNDLEARKPIFAGAIYYLQKKNKRAKVPFHVVRRGQSLWDIAQQYGIRLQPLIDYNELNPEQQPAVGRILWLQRKRPSSTPIEYYRPPEPPVSAPQRLIAHTSPPELSELKPGVLQKQEFKVERLPSRTPATSLDSLTALAVRSEANKIRSYSGATKMIQPLRSAETTKLEKPVANPSKSEEKPAEETARPLLMHSVEKGDTYASIAGRYKVSVQQLFLWNNLTTWKPLRAGQLLLIDTAKELVRKPSKQMVKAKPKLVPPATAFRSGSPPVKSAIPPSAKSPILVVADTTDLIHIVRAGENLYRIGLRYRVKPVQIQQWNHLPDLTAVVGARLIIRKK